MCLAGAQKACRGRWGWAVARGGQWREDVCVYVCVWDGGGRLCQGGVQGSTLRARVRSEEVRFCVTSLGIASRALGG